jgi:nucleoside-diphosphate-sugar epimerase
MTTQPTVLLFGGTGRTGGRVLAQLLARGIAVRAVVRSASRLPPGAGGDGLTVVEADPLTMSDEELQRQLRGCAAVVSCLGHTLSFRGVFGPPRDLVTRVTSRVCAAITALAPAKPVKLVLMSSVSVHRSRRFDPRRGTFDRAALWLIRALVPPARDNQVAADLLLERLGADDPFVQWVVVRPDSLLEGIVTGYELHDGLVTAVFSPASTNMANVAHFMCELVADPKAWDAWRGKLPVIVNAGSVKGGAAGRGGVSDPARRPAA